MTAVSGRSLLIKKAGTAIAGFKTNTLTVDGSPVDVTTKDDNGFRTLGDFAGVKSIDISGEGVWKVAALSDLALAPAGNLLLTDITVVAADGSVIAGDFYLANYEESGADDEAVNFSATLQSSGPWTTT